MNIPALRSAGVQRRALAVVRSVQHVRRYATPVAYESKEKDPQLGDYPQLPDVSRQYLPPTGWWDNQMRRNFGDTLHEREELYSMWGPDVPSVPPSKALFQFSIAVLAFSSIALFCKLATPESPVIPREYPYSGLVVELGGLEENKARPEQESEDE